MVACSDLKAGYPARTRIWNGKLRDELLNGEPFLHLAEARWVIDRWLLDYNYDTPHRSIDYQAPAAFAAQCASSIRPTDSLPENTGPMNPDPLNQAGTKTGGRSKA